ncbi:hypothetical protein FS749_013941 [Ceratobasidium sp. UAMH 11750]|nr:hypothetical protein FS749_013941 [Ceratobasidium sp. UAMH 11750]
MNLLSFGWPSIGTPFLDASKSCVEPLQLECHTDTKLEPQSTDTSTTDYPLFSEAEMNEMIQRAWAIKEAYERERGCRSEGRPKGLQTLEVHTISSTNQSDASTTCCSFLYSFYGHPEIQGASAEAQSLAKHEV